MSGTALDQLALAADAAEKPESAPGEPPPGAAPPESPNFAPLGMTFELLRVGACFMLKVETPKQTLNDANIATLAGVFAPVLDKYGINLGTILDGPEWQAAFVGGPILWRAWSELDMELKARRAKPVDADESQPKPAA